MNNNFINYNFLILGNVENANFGPREKQIRIMVGAPCRVLFGILRLVL
jgi:hypothetical protein